MKIKSFSTKIVVLCVILLYIPASLVGSILYYYSEDKLMEKTEGELRSMVNVTIGMIEMLDENVNNGSMTEEEAKEELRTKLLGIKNGDQKRPGIENFKLGESGFVFAVDRNGISVMNPTTEGKDLSGVSSTDGTLIFKEMVTHGETGHFFEYELQKDEEKLVYVKTEPRWGWTIGAEIPGDEAKGATKTMLYLVYGIVDGLLIIGGFISYFLTKRLTNPIKLVSKELNKAVTGDFSGDELPVKTHDEVGVLTRDFNGMRTSIKSLLSRVNESAEQVAASSEQLSASAEETSKATVEISKAIQQVASGSDDASKCLIEVSDSLEQVTYAIQNVSNNSSTMSDASVMAIEQAKQGNEYVQQTVKQITSIQEKVNESGDVLRILQLSSDEIGKISKVITDIADQTNLLALNAAIEAARAGEQGKGFAVVADEVRRLAEQSQTSSNQISQLIVEIQQNMTRSAYSMDSVKDEVQEGLIIVEKTELSFKEIVMNMDQLGVIVTELADTVEQMSAGADEITDALNNVTELSKESSMYSMQVAASTEEQLASMDEVSSAVTSLSTLAIELQHQVNDFKI